MTRSNPLQIWFDGGLHLRDSIPRGLLEQGLHYGTGVFEGIRAYATPRGPAIFRLDDHMDRLEKGAKLLRMDLDRSGMEQAMRMLMEINGLENAYIRPLAFYGGGKLHLDLTGLSLRHAVATLPWTSHLGGEADARGVRLFPSSMQKNSHRAIPTQVKFCGSYINAILAKLEATEAGFDEALFLDEAGDVVEASAENVFLISGDRVIAVEHPDALPGITRDTIAQLTGAERRRVSFEELLDADEVFLVGTSAEVAPVTQIGSRAWSIGEKTRAIQRTYQRVVHGEDTTGAHWLTLLD